MTSYELYLFCVLLLLLGLAAVQLRGPFRRLAKKIKEFEDEGDTYPYEAYERGPLWYLGGHVPHPVWIDHALDADYLMHTQWQNLPAYYAGRDLRTVPDWEPGRLGPIMETVWWVVVIIVGVLVFGGLIWGLMNRAGA